MLIMFNFGSSVVMGVSTEAAQDGWAALLMSVAFTLPVIIMYGRIAELNPGMGLFDAIEAQLGKVAGKVAAALLTWYALHLCALVLRNFSEFIQISSLLDTPQLPVMVVMMLTVSYLAKLGCKALGKWALATLPVVLFIVVLTVVLSINVMKFENILPVFEHSLGVIAEDAFKIFSFPLCETVLFLSVADGLLKTDNPKNIYVFGTLFSSGVLLVIILRNLFVLGAEVVETEYFPSYSAARIINLGDFISRIEGSISINFILAGITKITVCLIAAGKGLSRLFGIDDYRQMVIPTAFLVVALATIVYGNTMEMFAFIKYYAFYAMPFEVVLPASVWIASEIRKKKMQPALKH
ncbi:MAG: endospore germination permease [Clostridiales bacterium]|nr:endospore germination permease [Clostridiales bacterium]